MAGKKRNGVKVVFQGKYASIFGLMPDPGFLPAAKQRMSPGLEGVVIQKSFI
jgi:hypothetical protein